MSQTRIEWHLPKNMVRFLYKDGFLPVARTHLRLVALGKKSSTGTRRAVANATLDWDVEMSDASFRTGNAGEIALDDPKLLPGYDELSRELKEHHPNMKKWDGAPGQPTPEFSGIVNPGMASDYTYPNVPLILELRDPSMTPSVLPYDMQSGTVVTSWSRPPLATFEVNDFFDPSEYLGYLAERYSYLSNIKPPDLPIVLIRLGDSIFDMAFFDLQTQFATGNLKTSSGALQEDQLMNKVSAVLMRDLRIPKTRSPSDAFLAALQILARMPSVSPLAGPPGGLVKGILDALGSGQAMVVTPTVAEDWAVLGTLVFYLGTIAFGYRFGSFSRTTNSNGWWELDCTVRLKP